MKILSLTIALFLIIASWKMWIPDSVQPSGHLRAPASIHQATSQQLAYEGILRHEYFVTNDEITEDGEEWIESARITYAKDLQFREKVQELLVDDGVHEKLKHELQVIKYDADLDQTAKTSQFR